jgi:hypothetical protein
MATELRSWMAAALGGLAAVAVASAHVPDASAGGYYYHGRPYGYGFPGDRLGLSRDMAKLRDQMRSQQMQLQQQIRLQEEQIRLLRAQVSAQHQITGMQACYYRLSAGMETCEDLFAAGSTELRACRERVFERNPGCAGDVARPGPGSGG